MEFKDRQTFSSYDGSVTLDQCIPLSLSVYGIEKRRSGPNSGVSLSEDDKELELAGHRVEVTLRGM